MTINTTEFADHMDMDNLTGDIYVDFFSPFVDKNLPKILAISKLPNLMYETRVGHQIMIVAPISDTHVKTIISQNYSLSLSLGIDDYKQFVSIYEECCYIDTYKSNDKTFLFMIKNEVLQCIVDYIHQIYKVKTKQTINNFYLRCSALTECKFTNIKPTEFIERYIKITLKPISERNLEFTSSLNIDEKHEEILREECEKLNAQHEGFSARVVTGSRKNRNRKVMFKPDIEEHLGESAPVPEDDEEDHEDNEDNEDHEDEDDH